jgi:hypothetical protein
VGTDETDPEKIVELALDNMQASLCHQCSGRDSLEIGDAWDAVLDGDKPEIYKVSD